MYSSVDSVSNEIKKDCCQCTLRCYTKKKYSAFLNLTSLTVARFLLRVKEFQPFNTDLKHDLSNDNSSNVLNWLSCSIKYMQKTYSTLHLYKVRVD